MNIFTAYKYFFYRTYKWQINLGDKNIPQFTAILVNSMHLFLNLLTVIIWLRGLTGYKIQIENLYAIIGTSVILLINYFIFLYNNKYERIIAEFNSETELQRSRRRLLCLGYEIGTFLSFFGSILIFPPTFK